MQTHRRSTERERRHTDTHTHYKSVGEMSNQGVSPQMMSFLEQEKKKAAVNEIIGQLTNICWDKCMSTPGR